MSMEDVTLVRRLRQHPLFANMIILLIIVIPGFIRIEQLNNQLESQIRANTELNECLTQYAATLTDSLQDRDTVNVIARSAAVELWGEIRSYLRRPTSGDIQSLAAAIDRYQVILDRVTTTTEINPYPDISTCLPELLALELVASFGFPGKWDNHCMGRRVTIYGTRRSDIIHGTDGNDVVFAYSGGDLIHTGKGNDVVCARWGNDTINAGQDFDRVGCGFGDDKALQAEFTIYCE